MEDHRKLLAFSVSLFVIVIVYTTLSQTKNSVAATSPPPGGDTLVSDASLSSGGIFDYLFLPLKIALVFFSITLIIVLFRKRIKGFEKERQAAEKVRKRIARRLTKWAGYSQVAYKKTREKFDDLEESELFKLKGLYAFENTRKGFIGKQKAPKAIMEEMIKNSEHKFIFALNILIGGKSLVAFFEPNHPDAKETFKELFERDNGDLDGTLGENGVMGDDFDLPAPTIHISQNGIIEDSFVGKMLKKFPRLQKAKATFAHALPVRTTKGKLKDKGSYFEYLVETPAAAASILSAANFSKKIYPVTPPPMAFSLRNGEFYHSLGGVEMSDIPYFQDPSS